MKGLVEIDATFALIVLIFTAFIILSTVSIAVDGLREKVQTSRETETAILSPEQSKNCFAHVMLENDKLVRRCT